MSDTDVKNPSPSDKRFFDKLSDRLVKHIFSFLNGRDLGRVREVCCRWNTLANDPGLWEKLCLKNCRSLGTDKPLWYMIADGTDPDVPRSWRDIYPKLDSFKKWRVVLRKSSGRKFLCNFLAHQVGGSMLPTFAMPDTIVVTRRFSFNLLERFVTRRSWVFYLEPAEEVDEIGFYNFIMYLLNRNRAGLARAGGLHYIFVPPCDYCCSKMGYTGSSLVMVVQPARMPQRPGKVMQP